MISRKRERGGRHCIDFLHSDKGWRKRIASAFNVRSQVWTPGVNAVTGQGMVLTHTHFPTRDTLIYFNKLPTYIYQDYYYTACLAP